MRARNTIIFLQLLIMFLCFRMTMETGVVESHDAAIQVETLRDWSNRNIGIWQNDQTFTPQQEMEVTSMLAAFRDFHLKLAPKIRDLSSDFFVQASVVALLVLTVLFLFFRYCRGHTRRRKIVVGVGHGLAALLLMLMSASGLWGRFQMDAWIGRYLPAASLEASFFAHLHARTGRPLTPVDQQFLFKDLEHHLQIDETLAKVSKGLTGSGDSALIVLVIVFGNTVAIFLPAKGPREFAPQLDL